MMNVRVTYKNKEFRLPVGVTNTVMAKAVANAVIVRFIVIYYTEIKFQL